MRKICLSKNNLLILLIIILCIFLIVNTASTQGGRIYGCVTDETGKPIPDVKITITDPERDIKYIIKTNENGKYYQMGLYPTTYEITFELEGYSPVKRKIKVSIGELEALNVIMAKLDGLDFFKEGEYEDAVESLKIVTEKLPDYFDAFYYLGISYLMQGDIDNAIASLKRAQELEPEMVGVYLFLGECYIRKDSLEEASEVFSRAIELRPDKPVIHNIIGSLYDKYKKIDAAIASYQKSAEIVPHLSATYYQLGCVYLKKGDIDNSIAYFERFLELEPNDPKASRVKEVVDELKKRRHIKKEQKNSYNLPRLEPREPL